MVLVLLLLLLLFLMWLLLLWSLWFVVFVVWCVGCCCNSWRLYFMRRRVTYAMGASFIEHHLSMLFLSYLGCLGVPSGALWALLGCSLATPGPLSAAQAA